jgi:hypothetical protein
MYVRYVSIARKNTFLKNRVNFFLELILRFLRIPVTRNMVPDA